jgi:thiol-disulfide isomerase/thioredoxin
MNKFISICLIFFMLSCSFSQAQNQASEFKPFSLQPFSPRPFSNDAFIALKQQKLGECWLIVLWSLDCPACFKELKLLQAMQKLAPNKPLNVVYINADDIDEVAFERKQVLAVYEMRAFDNFYFVDGQADKSRYQIDPSWYGELPRSYFVDEEGKFHGKSGLLDEALIRKWLLNE